MTKLCRLALTDAFDSLARERRAWLAGTTGQTLGDLVRRYSVEHVEGLRGSAPGRVPWTRAGDAAFKALAL